MRQFLALLNKERRETQLTSLVIVLVGLVIPFIGIYPPRILADYAKDPGVFARAAILALWLNLTVLCATAFARERENGTLDALRNLVKDWRVAALGKFGYAFGLTLLLGVIFFLATLGIDKLNGAEPLTSVKHAFQPTLSAKIYGQILFKFALLSFVWGIFWTGRVPNQVAAILASVACSAFAGALNFNMSLVLSAAALIAAPIGTRFGFKTPSRSSGADSANAEQEAEALKKAQTALGASRRLGQFPTLYRYQLASAGILFRSPASIFFDLAALWLACFALFSFHPTNLATFESSAAFILFFCVSVIGLFPDVNAKDALLKSRFAVNAKAYWFSGVLAALTLYAVYGALYFLFLSQKTDIELTSESVRACLCGEATIFLSLALWIAALNISRLVKAALCVVTSLVLFNGLNLASDRLEIEFPYFFPSQSWFLTSYVLLGTVFGLTAVAASYFVVTQRMRYRSGNIAALVPAAALLLLASFAYSAYLPIDDEEFVPIMPEIGTNFDPGTLPASKEAYQAKINDAIAEVEALEFPVLFSAESKEDSTNGWSSPVYTNVKDAFVSFMKTRELAKRGAASPVRLAESEQAFYKELNALEVRSDQTAAEIAKLADDRPTPEEIADSAYLYFKYANLENIGNFDVAKRLEQMREKKPEIYNKALLAFRYVHPYALKMAVDPREVDSADAQIVNEYKTKIFERTDEFSKLIQDFWERSINNAAPIEEARLILTMRAIANVERRKNFQRNISYSEPLLPTSIGAPEFESKLTEQVYGRFRRSRTDKELFPAVDAKGNKLTTPDDKQCFISPDEVQFDDDRLRSRMWNRKPSISYDSRTLKSYFAFNEKGEALFSKNAKQYYVSAYDRLSPHGIPELFCYAPCDEDPPFPHDDMLVGEKLEDLVNHRIFGSKPLVSRVRILNKLRPCDNELVSGIWRIEQPKDPQAPATELREDYDGMCYINQYVTYVDDSGKELTDPSGDPLYRRTRGVFEELDAHQDGYAYIFELPLALYDDFARFKIYCFEDVGKYVEVDEKYAKIGDTLAHFVNPGVVMVVKNAKELFPDGDNDGPVLIYDPLYSCSVQQIAKREQ